MCSLADKAASLSAAAAATALPAALCEHLLDVLEVLDESLMENAQQQQHSDGAAGDGDGGSSRFTQTAALCRKLHSVLQPKAA